MPSRAAAVRALAELARAARAAIRLDEATELRAPSTGDVPIGPLDWLVLAAEEHGLLLSVVQAEPAELPEWLRRDAALVTALEEDGGGEGLGGETWVTVTRGEDQDCRITFDSARGTHSLEVPFGELTEALGLPAAHRHRWAATEPLSVAGSVAGATSEDVPLHPLRRLMKLLQADRRDLLAVTIFAVAIGVLLLATPIAVQALVNFVALGGAIPPLIVVVGLLFLGLAFAGILTAFQTWVVEILQRRIFVRTVADLSARLPRIALGAAGRRYGPELVNRFFDLATIQKVGSFLLLDGLSVLLSVFVGLVVLAFYHPLLLAFDILLLGVITLVVLGPIRRGIKTAKAESSAKYEVAAWLEEIAGNPHLFKSSGVMKAVFERTDRLARNYVEKRSTHFRIVFGQGVAAIALQVLASTALLGIGGLLVIQGSLTLGQLVAAELILTLVVSSVAKMGKHLEAFYDLMAATDKVGILLDLPVERSGGEHHLPIPGSPAAELELRSVAWAPPDGSTLFQGVSLTIAPGERIGISGASGVGKSALLELMWGVHDPTSGSLHLDGRDLRELSLESLRRTAAFADGIESFDGTVRENVHLGRPFVADDDVRSALRDMGLLEELAELPEGIDTFLAVDGRPLSAGQLARLQIARAIVSRPRLLLVANFFEELDATERRRVVDVLFDEAAPWTLVYTTNDEDALVRCDRTFLLSDGRLIESPEPVSA